MLEMPDFFRYGHLDLFGILKQILPGTGRDPGSWLLFLLGAVTCIMLFTGAAAEGKKRRPKESGSENDVN